MESGGNFFNVNPINKQKAFADNFAEETHYSGQRLNGYDTGLLNDKTAPQSEKLKLEYRINETQNAITDVTGKIKNAFFELLVNIRNITTEIDTSYENDEFASSFSFLTGENNMDKIEAFVQARCTECALDVLQVSQRQGNPIIEKAQEYIKEHIAENLSLDDTAQAVNVSSFYLSKLFKEERGENYITFITDMRMQKARELLRNPRASIKEVSISVCYNDQNYFSRIFRSKFGMTPTEFRDAAKD